ncbi:radical SAM family heme chaperone HemW [Caldisalinibacter kiritimatiensis]|uniref:Heme chaperone HemW n=1 Tax=Caldisalinibacter kiritimatiensis TaxID=1304284 RepID=R1CVB9_9FIRM|nr:radical SAM family heme chaperone HemW [Caldisalinibacter kiritimatiensis]EOD00584.1 Putative coproporphyrinogen III oxidase of BS HemN-type, oxygen-independent [Caldisalinibacter kiritimatiensis]
MKELGIYIHIPFCKSKCYYCDFKSFPDKLDLIDNYIYYLKKEIDMYSRLLKDYVVKTIFIGGGTPSILEGKYIYEIYSCLYGKMNLNELEEFTIETNPKTLDDEKLKVYKEININRVSIGAQTLNDKLLKRIGRIHNTMDFYKSYELIRKWGFRNVNVDIMFNLPNQTLENVIETLNKVAVLGVEHISFYSLKLEEGTRFYKEYLKSKLELPDEDEEREMYHKGIETLEQRGYSHYEISNFAKEGYECNHNLLYWKVKPYLGLGLAAHSNINSIRYNNYNNFKSYFHSLDKRMLPIEEKEKIHKKIEMAEYMILGLRLIQGINKKEFYNRFEIDVDEIYGEILRKLMEQGLLITNNNSIKLTKLGLDLSNIVFRELLS